MYKLHLFSNVHTPYNRAAAATAASLALSQDQEKKAVKKLWTYYYFLLTLSLALVALAEFTAKGKWRKWRRKKVLFEVGRYEKKRAQLVPLWVSYVQVTHAGIVRAWKASWRKKSTCSIFCALSNEKMPFDFNLMILYYGFHDFSPSLVAFLVFNIPPPFAMQQFQ